VRLGTAIMFATMDKLEEIADLSGFGSAPQSVRGQRASCAVWASTCYIEACGIAPSNLVGQLGARAGLY